MDKTVRNHTNTNSEFLTASGEMSHRIRKFDWSTTSLGSVENWPQSLRTIASICLNSNFPIAIYWGKELTLLYNDSWSPIPGNKHPWALGRPAKEVWPDIWEAIEPQFQKAFAGEPGGSKDALLPMQRHGYTEECYFDFTFTPVYGEGGKVEGVFNAVIETTYRVINERRTSFLRNLAVNLATAQTSADVYQQAISFIGKAVEDISFAFLYTYSPNGLVLSASTLKNPEQPITKAAWPFSEILQSGQSLYIENLDDYFLTIPRGFWPEQPKEIFIVPLKNNTGYITGFFVCGLSARRRIDADYKLFIESIGNTITTVLNNISSLEEERSKAEALAEIDRAKTAFFSNISHEFRTPLTLMLAPLEEVLQGGDQLTPKEKENLSVSYRNTLRLQKLVNTLLDFSRIEAGRMKANFQPVDICGFTTDLASSFRSAIEKEGMQLIVDCKPLAGPVTVDVSMWEKIVLNLLSNAFKYTMEGSIKVAIKQEGANIHLSVSDTGIGIPQDEQAKIFERFHRIENSGGRSQEGTGIGLSLVQEFVAAHGGNITVNSRIGKGSEFTVSIPAIPNESDTTIIIDTTAKENIVGKAFAEEMGQWTTEKNSFYKEQASPGSTKKHCVLVADDNSDMRNYIVRLLSEDYEVIEMSNGEEAFVAAVQHQPDLVISDVMMPKLDGFGLLKKLRENASTRNIPFMFLSARAGEEAKLEGLESGADDYIVKPFTAKELIVRVATQIKLKNSREATLRNLYNLFDEVPFAVAVLMGESLVVEFINQYNLDIWQHSKEQVLGKELFEIFPGNKESAKPVHDEVFRTGKRFIGNEMPIEILNNGRLETRWFNFIVDPLRSEHGKIIGQLATGIDVTDEVLARKKIEESEKYFRSLTDTVPAIIWITDPDGSCSYLNKNWYIYTGQTEEEAKGFGWLTAVHPDDSERAGKVFLEASTQQKPYNILYRLRDANGQYRWAIDRGSPRFSADGVYEGMIGTVLDVHDQKLAEESLRKTSAHLELATSAAEVGTWSFHVPTGTLQWSALHKRLWGYDETRTDLVYEDWHKVILPGDKEAAFAEVEKAAKTHARYEAIYRIKKANDGAVRWMRSSGQYFYNDKGEPVTLTGVSVDITEQKAAESAIRQSEEALRTLTEQLDLKVKKRTEELATLNKKLLVQNETFKQAEESSAQGSYSFNLTTGLLTYSDNLYKLLGYEPQEFAPSLEEFNKHVHPDDRDYVSNAAQRVLQTMQAEEWNYRMIKKDGEVIHIKGTGRVIASNREKLLVGTLQDITDDVLLKRMLQSKNLELERSNEDLQQFAHVASHDLKEPIRKVRTFGSRLEAEYGHLLPEKGKLYLAKMQSSAERMFGLIDGVLNYSTINSLESSNEHVELDKIIKDIEADLEVVLTQKNARLHKEPLTPVYGSKVLLNQLFYNLINNALKFSRPTVPPVISISSKKLKGKDLPYKNLPGSEKEFLQVSVCDNGIGFAPEHSEKIFKTFTRLNSRDKFEGTGLGLALCKKIAERHNGYIYATGQEGKGACFYVVLPL